MFKIFLLLILPLILFARNWTALVYMAADNDLAEWADSDLVELESVGSTEELMIIVQVDKPYIGAKRLLVENGSSQELQNMGIIDMCDWHVLSEFLEWGINNYPAKRYFVILWDHGSGWTAMPKRSFGRDWSSGSQLSIANGDFQKAISVAHSFTGETIDLFAFDACLMQMVEVAFELKDYAKICVASQTTCPLQGFRYDQIFQNLYNNPEINEVDLAKKVVEVNVENYSGVQPIVYSAINIDYLEILSKQNIKLFESLMIDFPSELITNIREYTQTIPEVGIVPEPNDEHVDYGDFIKRLDDVLEQSGTTQLLNSYNNTIVASNYWGVDFSDATGLTIWFPYTYQHFKQRINNYITLSWVQSEWLQFLNWFYGEDDIRPTDIDTLYVRDIGENNDFRLSWNKSFDLAPIRYNVVEARDSDFTTVLSDQCEDSSAWYFNGFGVDSNVVHSGKYSFYSGDGINLSNSIETKNALNITHLGLLSIYLYYNTEDLADSLIIEYGSFKDIHYGRSNGWQERRVILPAGNDQLTISYHTNGFNNKGGCYIDDIDVYDIENSKYIRKDCLDTTIYIYNKLRGTYDYAVFPEDRYGNIANISDFITLSIEQYALPYSNPNPFQASCDIILDYPDSRHPTIEIFSISGRKVKKFVADDIEDKTVHWDARDENNRPVGAGIYFVLLKDGSFKKVGKIACQR